MITSHPCYTAYQRTSSAAHYSESQKIPMGFSDVFPQTVGNF